VAFVLACIVNHGRLAYRALRPADEVEAAIPPDDAQP